MTTYPKVENAELVAASECVERVDWERVGKQLIVKVYLQDRRRAARFYRALERVCARNPTS